MQTNKLCSPVKSLVIFYTKAVLPLIFIICFYKNSSYAQSWQNEKLYGGAGDEKIWDAFADASGNMYVLGLAQTGLITPTLPVPSDFFISKINSSDQTVWTKDGDMQSSSRNMFSASSIAKSNANNELYVLGSYSGSVTFGSGLHVTQNGESGIFINRYDTGGILISANTSIFTLRNMPGSNVPYAYTCKLRFLNNGNFVVCGAVQADTVIVGGTTYTFNRSNSMDAYAFAILFNSAGVVINQIISSVSTPLYLIDDYYIDAQDDAANNIYLLGRFSRYPTAVNETEDIILTKCNSSLQVLSTQTLVTGALDPYSSGKCSFIVKGNGEFYITGYSGRDSMVFSTGTVYRNVLGTVYPYYTLGECCFLAKYDSSGVEQWVNTVGGYPCNILLYASDQSVYVSGYSFAPIPFGNHTTTGSIFLANYLPSGNLNTVNFSGMNNYNFGGMSGPYVETTALLEVDSGAIYLAGTIRDSLSFDNITLYNTLLPSVSCSEDAFLIKFQPNVDVSFSGIPYNNMENNILMVYPNPNNGQFNVDFGAGSEAKYLRVTNLIGEVVYSIDGNNLGSQNSIDVSFLSAGTYFVTIGSGNKSNTAKIIIY
jgi:hypothetical protein